MEKRCTCGGEIKSKVYKSFSLLVGLAGFHTDIDFRCEKCNKWWGHETAPFFYEKEKTKVIKD